MAGEDGAPGGRRLDQWLWFARIYRSRTFAGRAVAEGRIRVNRVPADRPGQAVRVGDVLTLTLPWRVRVLRVACLGTRRGPPEEARSLYAEIDLSPPS